METAIHLSPVSGFVTKPNLEQVTTYTGSPPLRVITLLLFIIATVIHYIFGVSGEVIEKLAPRSVMVFLVIAPVFIITGMIIVLLFLPTAKTHKAEVIKKYEIANIVLLSLVLAWVTLPVLYIKGFPSFIVSHIQVWLPYIGARTASVFSNVIAWLTTGAGSIVMSLIVNLLSSAIWDWNKERKIRIAKG